MNKIVEAFIPIVDFLAEMMGEDTEVALHDLEDLDRSIVRIKNNHISGRKEGGPATDLALKIVKQAEYKHTNNMINYVSMSKTGNILKSSTFIIRDKNKKAVGMICINTDCQKMFTMKKIVDEYLKFFNTEDTQVNVVERLSHSPEDVTLESIYKIISQIGINPERMSQDEKIEAVKLLNEQGVFLLKGAVSSVADALKVSQPTVYRYLTIIKKEGN